MYQPFRNIGENSTIFRRAAGFINQAKCGARAKDFLVNVISSVEKVRVLFAVNEWSVTLHNHRQFWYRVDTEVNKKKTR